jgi:hypothetical protein
MDMPQIKEYFCSPGRGGVRVRRLIVAVVRALISESANVLMNNGEISAPSKVEMEDARG